MNYKAFAVRTLVAVIFGPLIVLCFWWGHYFLLGLVLLIVLLSYWEYARLVERKTMQAQLVPGLLAVLSGVLLVYFLPSALVAWIFFFGTLFFFVEMYRKKGSAVLNLAATFFGSIYFTLFVGSFLLLRQLPALFGLTYDAAGRWMLLIVLGTWLCDTAAYLYGSYFGRHKLIPRISPNKSIEGTIAGFIAAILAAYICHLWFVRDLPLIHSLVLGAIVGSFGQYGDLFESMLKRDVDVKDSSRLIPGHGGILDRFDSLTISIPMAYLYLRFVVLT